MMRSVCAGCLSSELKPVTVAGVGQVVSFTTIRRAPTQFRDQAPYEVVVVDLQAGPRITGRLAADSIAPVIGALVHAVRIDRADAIFRVLASNDGRPSGRPPNYQE